ncbi:MAG: hypothetical protein E7335_08370 [Clostridiales bacterium]|nr:hypothetical protein [Clostridiales bacterium]
MDQKSLYKISYGLYLLTAQDENGDNGCIINTAVQVANDPTRLSIAVIKGGKTHDMVKATGVFNVSALTVDAPFALFKHFGMQSGRNVDKFADFANVARSENGLYYLTEGANGYISCKVVNSMDLTSHTLFIGEVTDGVVLSERPSCTYAYYQSDIKQKPAPVKKKGWVCSVCGYVHEGEDMPDDFICPICKHGKQDFVLTDAVSEAKPAPAAAAASDKWVCKVCGYVHNGAEAPAECPVCKANASKFEKQSGEFVWAAEHTVGVAQGAPEEIIEGLRANFMGECTEVGMYLAMARVAHREGYPEIGEYWEKAAYEEAEHAAKFAELLGEVVTDSTKKNLEMRVEAENGATAGKTELTKLAKQLNLDALHDTIHEMARDEARHGKAFAGLLARYFK